MNDSMNTRYERVYEVGLLDDLHNYFPGLLYDQERFRTVPDVLGYIRENTTRRFNLFDHGRRQYNFGRDVPQNTFVPSAPAVNRWVPPVQTRAPHVDVEVADVDLSILFPLLRSLDRLSATNIQRQPTATLFHDVIVHATQTLIDTTTVARTLVMDLENTCSICQDSMRQGEEVRSLNACHHEFHVECIDSWFLRRSVLCPVCRHDIRNPTPAIRSPLLGPSNPGIVPPLNPEEE